jgi:F-type H+-transporting ATPase subunit b
MIEETQLTAEAVHQAAEVVEVTGGIGTLGINLKIFIAQLINFTVVLFVLWKWVYGPVVKLLDERSEKIEKSVKHADEIEKRVGELAVEQKSVIAEAKSEAAKIMDEARAEADKRRAVLLEKAKADVQSVVTTGKAQLQSEKAQMIVDAREEIASIAVEAAKKILTESVDEAKAQKLAEEVVKEMS